MPITTFGWVELSRGIGWYGFHDGRPTLRIGIYSIFFEYSLGGKLFSGTNVKLRSNVGKQ